MVVEWSRTGQSAFDRAVSGQGGRRIVRRHSVWFLGEAEQRKAQNRHETGPKNDSLPHVGPLWLSRGTVGWIDAPRRRSAFTTVQDRVNYLGSRPSKLSCRGVRLSARRDSRR